MMTAIDRPGRTDWYAGNELIRPDVDLMTEQGEWRAHIAEPERRLLLGVLVDAIVRIERLASTPPGPRRQEFREAERWIRSNDRSWPCSFINVCEALGFAYEPLRRALLIRAAVGPERCVTRHGLVVESGSAKAVRRGGRRAQRIDGGRRTAAGSHAEAGTP